MLSKLNKNINVLQAGMWIVEAAIFESLPFPPLALPLPPLDDVIFAKNFFIFKFFGKNFFRLSQDKTALLSPFQKHHIEPNYNIIILSGFSLQGPAYGHDQKFEFGAALKQNVQSHGYFSAAANFSKRSPRK